MDPKELNELVHDREAAFYDDRFLIDFDGRIARDVRRDLMGILGEIPDVARALDVACGTGYGAVGLAAAGIAAEVHACDLSTQMVTRTRVNATRAGAVVHALRSDAEVLPYAGGSFDLVLARGALHHVPDPVIALREMRRVMAPRGATVVLAEPTPSGERQVARVVGPVARAVDTVRRLARRSPDDEHRYWELASMAANLHTFEPESLAVAAEKAGFEDITVGTASWAWILALGLNYYAMGEFGSIGRSRSMRRLARAVVDGADAFDRLLADRVVPARWRHTITAVLR